MDNTRRKFLKLAGLTAAAGVGATVIGSKAMASGAPAHGAPAGHGAPAAAHGGGHGDVATGVRQAIVIDTGKFNDNPGLAEKCQQACHSYHNVPDFGNPKDEIKWIWTDKFANVFPEHSHYKKDDRISSMDIIAMCNHCENPPCVRACPTQATFKNADGAVMMDFHRCIGCRFCMAACPYGARSFNWRSPRGVDKEGHPFIEKMNPKFPSRMRGVVEKCSLCSWRTKKGLDPLCVEEANKTAADAMIFGDLNDKDSKVAKLLRSKFTIQRKPALGTKPSIFYII
ncbi:MAG: 4Fe-4S dicluster domain-containing protein [Desulfobulbaceae bacterium]|jgi:Fe-S-cluster-containing dehydrogenase component|nr:4Fe-4S dicluster domain-containing protein [Desulfobulbaceae bacterium]